MKTMWRHTMWAALAAAALATGACTRTVSDGVDEQGVPDETKWHDLSYDESMKIATTPNHENLSKLRAGMNKRDLYQLLGTPHFREMFGAREWDYLFKYQEGEETKFCEFKIVFDNDKLAGTFHWNPADCGRHFGVTQPLPSNKR